MKNPASQLDFSSSCDRESQGTYETFRKTVIPCPYRNRNILQTYEGKLELKLHSRGESRLRPLVEKQIAVQ